MEKIATGLDVLPEDLMTASHGERVMIPEVDINSIKDCTDKDDKSSLSVAEPDNILMEWALPKKMVDNQIGANSTVRIIQILGDSMQPDYHPGDRIMVNTADRMPSPPGVFVLWDGFGLIIKRCEMVQHSKPARVILSSSNPNYSTYEMDIT